MNEVLPRSQTAQASVEGLHISLGLTILLLVLARIAIRIAQPPSPLPAGLPRLDATLARVSHALFYVLLLVLPLTGWVMVSAGKHPISWWGIPWPRLPVAGLFGGAEHKPLRHALMQVHTNYLIWIVLVTAGAARRRAPCGISSAAIR